MGPAVHAGVGWASRVRLPPFSACAAAITATYAPTRPAPRSDVTRAPHEDHPAAEVLHRGAGHGDEHVIKFTDTVVEAYERTPDPDLLAAALRAGELIGSPA